MQQEVRSAENIIQLKCVIRPSKVAAILGFVSLYLAAQSLFNEYLIEKVLNQGNNVIATTLLDLFSVNLESSIPTWYTVVLLFASALLLGVIAWASWRSKDRLRYYWAGLSILFAYLSIDEGAAIHEIFSDPLQTIFHSTGYFSFGWEIIAIPLLLLFSVLYLPFVFQLAPHSRYLFVASGLVYVAGALIFEAVSANRWFLDRGITFAYLAIGTVEELFEMLGVVLFIYALLAYIAANLQPHGLSFIISEDRTVADLKIAASKTAGEARFGPRRWRLTSIIGFILLGNIVIFLGAKFLQQGSAATLLTEPVPFYQKIIDQYSGQGVIVLRVEGAFIPGNPVAQRVTDSLLVLFNDVTVVGLPDENFSIAFASSTVLPFNKDNLQAILLANQDEGFVIFDYQDLANIASQK